jgi:hypothetical protein
MSGPSHNERLDTWGAQRSEHHGSGPAMHRQANGIGDQRDETDAHS